MKDVPILSADLLKIQSWLGSGSINIFGLPFSGKDTHGRILADLLSAPMIGGGDILRNSPLPENLMKSMNEGELFPTEEYIKVVTPYFEKPELHGKPLILSSVGRWIGEEQGIIHAARTSAHDIKAVIYLHVSENTIRERWLASQRTGDRNGRVDDEEHKLATRISVFNNKTLPVIDVYRGLGLLIEVDSDENKNDVTNTILYHLLELANHA